MITPETAVKWMGVVGAGAVGAYFVIGPVILFFSYRADYIKAEMPEPTLLAFKLTMSSLRKMKKFKAGDVEHPHRRKGDEQAHHHARQEDMSTVSRPMSEILAEMPKRKTPDPSHKRRSHE